VVDVLYEDNHVLVAVKPPNMLSQADETGDSDMLTVLKEYIRDMPEDEILTLRFEEEDDHGRDDRNDGNEAV
jgi:23S rRNA-/tRNA-specific pseudouridylate synthase